MVLPEGVNLELKVTVQDDFGVRWVNVWVSKLGEKKIHFGDEQEVTRTFKFDIGAGAADRFLYKGFDINVTAMDRNENLGYKEAEMPGIVNMVLNALLGALLAYVKFILELVSSMLNWIFDFITNILNVVIETVQQGFSNIFSGLMDKITGIYDNCFEGVKEEGEDRDNDFNPFLKSLITGDFFLIVCLLVSTFQLITTLIVTGISFGMSSIISLVIGIIIPILLICIMQALGEGSLQDGFKSIVLNTFSSTGVLPPLDDPWWENGLSIAVLDIFNCLLSAFSTLITGGNLLGSDAKGLVFSFIGLILAIGSGWAAYNNYPGIALIISLAGFLFAAGGFCSTLLTFDAFDAAGGPLAMLEEIFSFSVFIYASIDFMKTFVYAINEIWDNLQQAWWGFWENPYIRGDKNPAGVG